MAGTKQRLALCSGVEVGMSVDVVVATQHDSILLIWIEVLRDPLPPDNLLSIGPAHDIDRLHTVRVPHLSHWMIWIHLHHSLTIEIRFLTVSLWSLLILLLVVYAIVVLFGTQKSLTSPLHIAWSLFER